MCCRMKHDKCHGLAKIVYFGFVTCKGQDDFVFCDFGTAFDLFVLSESLRKV